MTVEVQLFAAAREAIGSDSVLVSVADDASFADLATVVAAEYPLLADLVGISRFASEGEYAVPTQPVEPMNEIALIPPVSGG